MSTLSEAPWGDLPYDHKTFAEVVDDYVLIRGDLCEEYARKQLVRQHERIVAARVEAALAPVRELAEEWEATRNGVLSPGLFWAVDDLTERGIVQPLTGMIMGVDHDYAPSGSKDVPLRTTPTPEPCRWTNGGAPACSETRDERYWCEPCRERREVDRDPAIERMIADPDGYYADARAAARAEVEADEQRRGGGDEE